MAYGNAHFGAGVGLIYLNNVGCTGAETSLLQCSYTTASSCTYAHSEDAGVRCQGMSCHRTPLNFTFGFLCCKCFFHLVNGIKCFNGTYTYRGVCMVGCSNQVDGVYI